MLYYFLYQLLFQQYGRNSESYFVKALNVIQYVTFRTGLAAITADTPLSKRSPKQLNLLVIR